eukprot:scaffold7503_cov234-Alexandrium_tamarense.AAC.1
MLILRRHSEEHPNSIEDEDDVHVKSDLLLLDNPGDAVARAKQRSKASKKNDKSKASKTKRSEGKNEKKQEPETEDPVLIAIRLNCKPPPNNYRTCFHRAVDQSNKLGIDVIQEAFPFTTPFVDEDEELVHGSLHLSLAQYEIMNMTCEDIIAMEMISLRYLDVRKNVRTSCHLLRPLPVLTHHRL